MESVREIWPPEYLEMERIEELLKCGICYDFIDTTVITPCSHNYCSLCIRRYLHYKTQCPACFQITFDKDLHTNRILDEVITHFVKIRAKLVNCVSTATKIVRKSDCLNESCELSMNFQPIRPPRTNHYHKPSSKSNGLENTGKSLENGRKLMNETDESKEAFISMPYTIYNTLNIPIGNESNDCKWSDKQVSCLVCKVKISKNHIEKHHEECIKRESIPKKNPALINDNRKQLPKLVFNLMKESELKKKMKQLNLPTQGDRYTLENRFQRYCTLYNAECDKKTPRSIAELLKQCKEEELIETKMRKSLAINKMKTLKNAEQTVIDEANTKYLEMNVQSYQNLVESIKSRVKYEEANNNAIAYAKCITRSINSDVKSPEYNEPIHSKNNLAYQCNPYPSISSCSNANMAIGEHTTDIISIATETFTNNNYNEMVFTNSRMNGIDDENEPVIEDHKNCPSINSCTDACHGIRKRNHHSFEINTSSKCTVSANVQPNNSLSIAMLHHNKNININHVDYTDDISRTVRSDSYTMKRRRRQKCVTSSTGKEINPPSRPARKRDSLTIAARLMLSDDI